MDEVADLERLLSLCVARRFGRNFRIRDFARMAGGHAGFTYGFALVDARSGGHEELVLKKGPAGVRREGVADVHRQAPLLRVLRAFGLPVPEIRWADAGEDELGAPYIVMQRMPGRERFPLNRADDARPVPHAPAVWTTAVDTLVEMHRVPASALADWAPPRALGDEFSAWERTLRKSPEAAWIDDGLRTRDALSATMPAEISCGVCHGDFQPSNLLFEGSTLTSIIDWDLASVGPSLLDIGWLLMFADADYWGRGWAGACPVSVEALQGRFCRAIDARAADLTWFRAFAGYRFGAIACLNVRLHRTGRRVDAAWERFASDVPAIFARARRLAAAART